MCRVLEKAIKDDTGYEVVLAVKEHLSFVQQLKLLDVDTKIIVQSPEHLLLKSGNCIPLALAVPLGTDVVEQKLTDAGQGVDYPIPSEVRTYREVAALLGCTLTPCVQKKEVTKGQWVMHTAMCARPHCVCLEIEADDTAYVHNGGVSYKTTWTRVKDMIETATDNKHIVFFNVNKADSEIVSLLPLLDLQAGTGVPLFDCDLDQVFKDMPTFASELSDEEDDEANVNVERCLKKALASEVSGVLTTIASKKEWLKMKSGRDSLICPFCPKREFSQLKIRGSKWIRHHIENAHCGCVRDTATAKDFVASGSKQFQLIRALYDQQISAHGTPSGLLQKSAKLMRSWIDDSSVVPEGMAVETAVDRKLALCLTGDGPKYLCAEFAKTSGSFRSVGYFYYDQAFATIFFSEMLRHKGKAKTIATSLMSFFLANGCQVVFLLPRKASTVYLKLMEDIMSSPVVEAWRTKLIGECLRHKEFVHLSMDATVRIAMRIKGQANYREPKDVRDSYIVSNLAEV